MFSVGQIESIGDFVRFIRINHFCDFGDVFNRSGLIGVVRSGARVVIASRPIFDVQFFFYGFFGMSERFGGFRRVRVFIRSHTFCRQNVGGSVKCGMIRRFFYRLKHQSFNGCAILNKTVDLSRMIGGNVRRNVFHKLSVGNIGRFGFGNEILAVHAFGENQIPHLRRHFVQRLVQFVCGNKVVRLQ